MFDSLRRLADRTSRVDALVQRNAYGPMDDIAEAVRAWLAAFRDAVDATENVAALVGEHFGEDDPEAAAVLRSMAAARHAFREGRKSNLAWIRIIAAWLDAKAEFLSVAGEPEMGPCLSVLLRELQDDPDQDLGEFDCWREALLGHLEEDPDSIGTVLAAEAERARAAAQEIRDYFKGWKKRRRRRT